jgi:hypothetical protein
VRNAAYTFDTPPGKPRPNRIENGQVAIVESVDPERDTLTVLLHEPGAEPRLVEIDQATLRADHVAGKRSAAVRLNYALHSFPAQGATVHATATLAGHWSQAKQETYVADTRAVYRHSVHVAREDLGTDGTDEDRIGRYAQRISESRQRHATVRWALDPTLRLAVELPASQPTPGAVRRAAGPGGASLEDSRSSPSAAAPAAASDPSTQIPNASDARQQRRAHADDQLEHLLEDPPEQLVRALGPVPQERIARERWEREARRVAALGSHGEARPAPTPHTAADPALVPRVPSSPRTTPKPRSNPVIDR